MKFFFSLVLVIIISFLIIAPLPARAGVEREEKEYNEQKNLREEVKRNTEDEIIEAERNRIGNPNLEAKGLGSTAAQELSHEIVDFQEVEEDFFDLSFLKKQREEVLVALKCYYHSRPQDIDLEENLNYWKIRRQQYSEAFESAEKLVNSQGKKNAVNQEISNRLQLLVLYSGEVIDLINDHLRNLSAESQGVSSSHSRVKGEENNSFGKNEESDSEEDSKKFIPDDEGFYESLKLPTKPSSPSLSNKESYWISIAIPKKTSSNGSDSYQEEKEGDFIILPKKGEKRKATSNPHLFSSFDRLSPALLITQPPNFPVVGGDSSSFTLRKTTSLSDKSDS